jgi:O-antigen/teichoic acid export membrane protein
VGQHLPEPTNRPSGRAAFLPGFLKAGGPLPEGTAWVGAGLAVLGLTAYGFLVVSARAVGPSRYASLSALWAAVYLAGPGFFLPLEQEVGRAVAARRAHGQGGAPVIRRAGRAGAGLAFVLIVVVLAASGPLKAELFDGDALLVVALACGLAGYFFQYLVRGALSGTGRFTPYGVVLATDGSLRLVACVALAGLGVSAAGPYGLAVGLAPLAAAGVGWLGPRGPVIDGPEAHWGELSHALGLLLAGSLFAQVLVNAGPLAVKLLASDQEQATAGRFLAGLVLARVPLFLFASVQAALLPELAGLAATGRSRAFASGLRRILIFVVILGATAVVAAPTVGPTALRILFGEEFGLSRAHLTYLAAGSAFYMLALTLAQAHIALADYARVAVAWLVGIVSFVVVTAAVRDLLLRVELGFLAGSAAAALAMGIMLTRRLRSGMEIVSVP